MSDLVRATELFLIETRPAGGLQLQNKKKNGDCARSRPVREHKGFNRSRCSTPGLTTCTR
ncbi:MULTISPECIES: hypothetical protein [unclassified Cryobacterium]|uniref:hypothetical protein n=1 Tax=unclassified Cryobacterium TaxID=2649013 RepID=UPI001E4EEEFF|nr:MULTISPECIES: hypothetical protein [unclassified Cryobacterium]